MRSFSAPFVINKWRPPEYGPSNPRRRNFCTNFRHDMFLTTFDGFPPVGFYLESTYGLAVSHFEKKPILHNLPQFHPAILEVPARRPDAGKTGDFPKITAVLQDLVFRFPQFFLDKLVQHD